MMSVSESLPFPLKLNAVYVCFDVKNREDLSQGTVCCDSSGDTPVCVSEFDVSKGIRKVHRKKAAPDGISIF